ncbi:MAG: UDP-N-acetylmuramoyl-L-alanyl-D-glutamate--2,6-diaminopimelate ligase [Campylobacterota bacterium]|nr:UDP-N-acetylmuramoyl-L-alanyl-D-glutamate--2,6-diaminopimelate ligase [Campylobacterota bacterium]
MTLIQNNKIFTDNSNEVTKDSIFVVSKYNDEFLDDAKSKGAKEVIKSNELAKYFDFSKIKVVGITGTNGKTTTAAAIYSILLDLGYKVALQGTRGFFINDEKIEDYTLTTPVQLGNFSHIQKALENGCEYFIMEVSSHAIEQNRIEGLDFALKVHTNITSDHLDYHGTLQEYIDVKNSFFQDDSMKLINKDDPNIKFKMKNVYAYGLDNPATYKISAYSLKNGIHAAMEHFANVVSFTSPMMGLFNIYNLTAAIASVNLITKEPLQKICDEAEFFAGVSGRMEVVSTEPLIIIDFAHTKDGMEKVLNNFLDYDIITVFGAGGDRDRTKRPAMGMVASQHSKEIIITSDNPRYEDPDQICEDILQGIKTKDIVTVELNRKEAIKKALELAKSYDKPVICILGKGDEQNQIIYDQKMPLNDKNIVLEILG